MAKGQQSAYDRDQPNAGRRSIHDRVIYIFRLYQSNDLAQRGLTTSASGFLGKVQGLIQTARSTVAIVNRYFSPLKSYQLLFEFRFPLIVERYEESTELRSNLQYEEGGVFIDTMRVGLGLRRFRISGRTFWDPVQVNGVTMDGDAALKTFKEVIEDYMFPSQGRGRTSDYVLRWINLNAPVSAEDPFGEFEWFIHPTSGVSVSQDSRQPLQRRWQFDFVGLVSNRDIAKSDDSLTAGVFGKSALGGLLGLIPGGLGTFLGDVFETVQDFQDLIDEVGNLIASVTDYVQGVGQKIGASIAGVRGMLTSVEAVIGRLEEGIQLVQDIAILTENDLRLLRQDFPGLAKGDASAGWGAVQAMRQVRNLMLALLAQPQNFVESINTVNADLTKVQSVPVAPGMSLEKLAFTFNVSPDVLVKMNGLRYPFVDPRERPEVRVERIQAEIGRLGPSDQRTANLASAQLEVAERPSQAGVLYAGDPILAPRLDPLLTPPSVRLIDLPLALRIAAVATPRQTASRDAAGNVTVDSDASVDVEDRLFGIDWLIDENQDLVWEETRKDIVLDRGLQHMQNVQVRYILLPLGGLRFMPGIGNFAYADLASWQTPSTNQLLAYAIWRTLVQDPRVQEIRNVTATTHAGVAAVQYDAVLINGQSLVRLQAPV